MSELRRSVAPKSTAEDEIEAATSLNLPKRPAAGAAGERQLEILWGSAKMASNVVGSDRWDRSLWIGLDLCGPTLLPHVDPTGAPGLLFHGVPSDGKLALVVVTPTQSLYASVSSGRSAVKVRDLSLNSGDEINEVGRIPKTLLKVPFIRLELRSRPAIHMSVANIGAVAGMLNLARGILDGAVTVNE